MADRQPALARLDVLVGRWTVQPKVDAPGFNQRFTGTVSADGTRIDGRWEMSKDGETWNLDFELSYVRE